jgi:hypothetical protein
MARWRGRGKSKQDHQKHTWKQVGLTVMAFALVMFVIPMAFSVSDAINDSAASSTQLKCLTLEDFGHQASDGGGHLLNSVTVIHTNATGTTTWNALTLYDADTLSKDYNQVIVTYTNPTENAARLGTMMIQANVSTQWLIAHNIVAVKISLNTSSAKELSIGGSAYTEGATGYAMNMGVQGGGVNLHKNVAFPVEPYGALNATWAHETATQDIHVNTTSTRWTSVTVDVDATNLLKADTYLGSATNSTFIIALLATGNTDATSLIEGDSVKFRVEFIGSAVSSTVISEYMVGGLGVILLLAALVCTPWVNPSSKGTRRRSR